MFRKWIEAMRLRTIPVSIAGVITGTALAIWKGEFSLLPALLCLVFAISAQIASNFGNEYYDFVNGMDKKGREGFRRGVTEGDITPKAMKYATFLMLGMAALTGCSLLLFGGWWLLPVGLCVMIAALAYSTGPYPLSHHGLGDLTVVIFFGVVPVTLTFWLQTEQWCELEILLGTSVSVGLMAANVLIVNNYRDMDDDRDVGKNTTVVLFGRKVMGTVYLISGILAMALMIPLWLSLPEWIIILPAFYLMMHVSTWRKITKSRGSELNPLLGKTAMNLLMFSLMLLAVLISARLWFR